MEMRKPTEKESILLVYARPYQPAVNNYALRLLSKDLFNRSEDRFESFMYPLVYLVLNAKGHDTPRQRSLDCSGGSAGV